VHNNPTSLRQVANPAGSIPLPEKILRLGAKFEIKIFF
jgi:hypothetical protein